MDSSSNVYVVDQLNNRVQKFDSNGGPITQWGSPGGIPGNGNGEFWNPYGIAVNSAGTTIYVVDATNYRVQAFDQNGAYLTQWGNWDQLGNPIGVAVDSNGYVYVSNTDSQSQSKNFIEKFDSNGVSQLSWSVNAPQGMAIDSNGYLFVITETNNIKKFVASTGADTGIQWGGYGPGAGQFAGPQCLAVDSANNVYVADMYNSRIQKFDNDGHFLCVYYTTGNPVGIAFNSSGDMYTGQGDVIYRYDPCSGFSPIKSIKSSMMMRQSTPTFIVTPITTHEVLYQSVVAAPNISRNGDPVQFKVALPKSARARLSLYNIIGESIYQDNCELEAGINTYNWNGKNQAGQDVASGLYIYVFQLDDGVVRNQFKGKIAIIR